MLVGMFERPLCFQDGNFPVYFVVLRAQLLERQRSRP